MSSPLNQSDRNAPWHRRVLSLLRQPRYLAPTVAVLLWLVVVLEWLWAYGLPDWLRWVVFSLGALVAAAACGYVRHHSRIIRAIVASVGFIFIWPFVVFAAGQFGAFDIARALASLGVATLFLIGLAWTVWGVERGSRYYQARRREAAPGRSAAMARDLPRSSLAFDGAAAALPAPGGLDLSASLDEPGHSEQIWNPIDLEAWYYGRKSRKLNQSITTIFAYALVFFVLVFLFNRLGGCQEIYEMPAGGGEEKPKPQQVKIQNVVVKKYVINPLSSVIFNPPPIEEVKPFTPDMTKHEYQIGQGKGAGAGFSGGTNRGKVRFIRLEYSGGDWDQDFGVGADLNMLLRYGIDTGHQVHDKTESRTIEELSRFPIGKSPPLVYMTGQRAINLSKREVEILREFLLDKHGMIFADNGGSSQWHGQFFSMMDKVLDGTGAYPVKVPLDDVIHRIPFGLPFLPYVAPHGGKDAWGWYRDGRWLAYYHPGDIGDAWSDGHAGVSREIYEACFQLGVNVIFYAHAEYNKWLDTREKKE